MRRAGLFLVLVAIAAAPIGARTMTTTTPTEPLQCCVPGSAGGAFLCELESAAQCAARGGVNQGAGTCSPNPCMSPTECELANEEQEERGHCPTTTTRPAPPVTSTTQPAPATTAPVTTPLGTCVPLTGLDAVSCRLDQIKGLLAGASPTAIASPALRRRLLAKLAKLDHLLQVGRAGGRRGRSALRRADHRLGAFLGAITSAANRSRLDLSLTTNVVEFAIDAKAALHPLVAQR